MKKRLATCLFLLFTVAASLSAEEKIVLKIASVAPSRSPWDI